MVKRKIHQIFMVSKYLKSILKSQISIYGSVDPASNGLEIADERVHENTGPVSDQDVRFHEGLYQGGHTTEALESLGGCGILSDPGNSDNNKQDDNDDDNDDDE
jgi:hypothetical protein